MPSVKKFGGSSVSTAQQVRMIAIGCQVGEVVVLSARAGRTESLIKATSQSDPLYTQKVGLGEYESCMRLHLELCKIGKQSIVIHDSKTGLEVCNGVEPKICKTHPEYIQQKLSDSIVIVPGFQARTARGVHRLLSRGGSDETAVALAIGLNLPCIIYSDIAQIYNRENQPLGKISYENLLQLIDEREAPMSRNSIELAKMHQKRIIFRHWDKSTHKTVIL